MRRFVAAIAVWSAAIALLATINAQAKPGGIITPDVVGMTVAEAVEAWAEAGFLVAPTVSPGDLDPSSTPDAIVLGQDPEAGSRQFADYPGVLYLEAVSPPAPSPTPTPTSSPTPAPSPTANGGEDASSVGDFAGGVQGSPGSLSFTQ
jgi:hypothetical protein